MVTRNGPPVFGLLASQILTACRGSKVAAKLLLKLSDLARHLAVKRSPSGSRSVVVAVAIVPECNARLNLPAVLLWLILVHGVFLPVAGLAGWGADGFVSNNRALRIPVAPNRA